MSRKTYNPEKRTWRGRSYRKGGERVRDLREKCTFMKNAMTLAAREAGCPLDHCECGTHDIEHKCVFTEHDEEVAAAERASGWSRQP